MLISCRCRCLYVWLPLRLAQGNPLTYMADDLGVAASHAQEMGAFRHVLGRYPGHGSWDSSMRPYP